jgi:hypothetical protein
MNNATFYKWRAKYDGMGTGLMSRMKEPEEENAHPHHFSSQGQ